jgi:hypothetical protein
MPELSTQGMALASEAECVNGMKSIFRSDDDASGGHSIWRGFVPCGSLF